MPDLFSTSLQTGRRRREGRSALGVASVKPDKGYFARIFPSAPEMRIDQRAAFSELLSRSPFISNSPVGKARFDAHKAQYEALNKIYRDLL